MDYISRLNNFGDPAIGDVAEHGPLNEETFAIFKKFNLNVRAMNVLLDNLRSIERAVEFAFRVEEDAVWIHSVGYIPDYLSIFQTILGTDPQEAVIFALMMSHMQGGCPIDYNTITDLFLQVNPGNAPLVVNQLLDDECPVDFIRSLLPVVYLVEQCEKRSRLLLLTQLLEHLVNEISQDVLVHIALVKIIYDCNNNPELFLTTNPYYDSRVEEDCDDQLIKVTNKNALFKLQARYVVQRMDPVLWEKDLSPDNEFRRQLLDQVVSTAIPESKCPELVSAAVKDFTTADLPHEPLVLLEKIVLQNSAISGNFNL
ncbi:hypothetical protein H6P81_018007 [Aristolochia fimbriata]|uniref:Uncharacterized protein n=1 Tax=Aristolochia fimbriata TaxID=158543 RepID=A0AAV7E0K2_ARIFI|nr:hypothetical protein H6P81_018007 [Aristolochia fimbriata]